MEQEKSNVGAVVLSIIITAVVVGGGVYVWKKSTIMTSTSTSVSANTTNRIKFPVVVYSREGLLTATEKKNLEEKFVNPYTDYNNENEDGINLVALYIIVPKNIGEEYGVVGIFGSEKRYGVEEFGFGKREQVYGYWQPECMGACVYSDAFKAKYPHLEQLGQQGV